MLRVLIRKHKRGAPSGRLSYCILQDAAVRQLAAQVRRVAVKDNTGHTGIFRRLNVGRGIVDEQAILRLQTELPEKRLIDGVLRLQQAVVRGDERTAEVLAAGNVVPVGVWRVLALLSRYRS